MYKPGDTIAYKAFGDELRFVKVELHESNVNNGHPGFVGRDQTGAPVWGYDSQIVFAPGMLASA